jgi:hypothetical protein
MVKLLDRFLVKCHMNGFTSQLILMAVPLWFCVVLSFDTQTFATSRSYEYMQYIMPEWAWAAASGLCFLLSLILFRRGTYQTIIVSNGILAFWHGLIAICILVSNPYGTGSGTYGILALGSGIRLFALTNAYRKNLHTMII